MAKEAAFALKDAGKLTPHGLNITVNAIAPGFVERDMLDGVPEKVLAKIRSEVPLDRLGRPEEIAARGPLPRRRPLVVYHRAGVGCQWRPGDVAALAAGWVVKKS
jgi:NAD(P)-dependent dehydrogenase (short-subunit alcohol dehydrogenase family)